VHADPDQLNAEAREQAAGARNSVDGRRAEPRALQALAREPRPRHARQGLLRRGRADDEVAVDTGDDRQARLGGAGPHDAPDPAKFEQNATGRMGGPGWGSEAAGGSAVDRRPADKRDHREAEGNA
jgi:hypothetical protein